MISEIYPTDHKSISSLAAILSRLFRDEGFREAVCESVESERNKRRIEAELGIFERSWICIEQTPLLSCASCLGAWIQSIQRTSVTCRKTTFLFIVRPARNLVLMCRRKILQRPVWPPQKSLNQGPADVTMMVRIPFFQSCKTVFQKKRAIRHPPPEPYSCMIHRDRVPWHHEQWTKCDWNRYT